MYDVLHQNESLKLEYKIFTHLSCRHPSKMRGNLLWGGLAVAVASAFMASPYIHPVVANVLLSLFAFLLAFNLIPGTRNLFIEADMYGIDLNKETKEKVYVLHGCICFLML